MSALRLLLTSLLLTSPVLALATPLSQCEMAAVVKLSVCPMPCCKTQAPKPCPELIKKAPQELAAGSPSIDLTATFEAVAMVSIAPSRPHIPTFSFALHTIGPPAPDPRRTPSGLSPPRLA